MADGAGVPSVSSWGILARFGLIEGAAGPEGLNFPDGDHTPPKVGMAASSSALTERMSRGDARVRRGMGTPGRLNLEGTNSKAPDGEGRSPHHPGHSHNWEISVTVCDNG